MAPGAMTAAGREAAKRAPRGGSTTPPRAPRTAAPRTGGGSRPSAPSHRRGIARRLAPKAPRRVSGPAAGAGGITLPRPGISLPERPARAPQPARPQSPRAQPARPQTTSPRPARPQTTNPRPARSARPVRPARAVAPLSTRAIALVRSLPDHPLLDRVVRGRTWIALLGVMLAGIVAMQVEVLKLGAGIGRSIERSSTLQSRNELLRASVAELSDDHRIMRLAAGQGMVVPPPAGVGFLSAGAARLGQALANIHPPNATAFTTMTTSNGSVTTPASLAAGSSGSGATAGGVVSTQSGTPTQTGTPNAVSTATPTPTAAGTATSTPTTVGTATPTPTTAVPPASPTTVTPTAGATPTGVAVGPVLSTQTSGATGSGGAPTG